MFTLLPIISWLAVSLNVSPFDPAVIRLIERSGESPSHIFDAAMLKSAVLDK